MLDAWRRDAWSREIDLDSSGNSRSARLLQPETKISQDFFFLAVLLKNGVKYVFTLNNSIFGKMGWWGCKTDQQFGSFF